MIEQAMIFMLGFLTAALLWLACLPAVWNRAVRLSRRRLSQLVPLSMAEIVAERDQIRAGFAVELRRLEQKLERSEGLRAEAQVELGRSVTHLGAVTADFQRVDAEAASLRASLEATQAELRDFQGQAGAAAVALYDVSDLAERRRWEVLDAEGRVRALNIAVDAGRASVAGLETKIAGLESRVSDLRKALATATATNERLIEEARAEKLREAELDEADFPALRAAITKLAEDVLALNRAQAR